MSRPGKFLVVHTDAGFHVRLVGANGEPVLTSEPYTEMATAVEAIGIAADAVDALREHVNSIEEVDERTTGSSGTGVES